MSGTTVVDYTIIVGSDSTSLKNLVRAKLEEGWQPLGGLAPAVTNDFSFFGQAMVKYGSGADIKTEASK